MKILSFAQNQEDILLSRAFPDGRSGFYIDAGAGDPVVDSVTKLFYERGWHGINIEPIPTVFELLARDRARDINLPIGLSDREGTLVFYEVPAAPSFSTFSRSQSEEHRLAGYEIVEHFVPVTTLARLCEQHDVPTIDFLKIDVEGHEREVLEGADWERYRPRVVVVEATKPSTTILTHEQWESLLLSADYLFAFFDGLNRYYVRAEDRELVPLLSVPANVFDDFEPFQHRHRVQVLEHQVQELGRTAEGILASSECARVALEDTRATLEDTRATLEDTRAALADTRTTLEDTRVCLAGTSQELVATQRERDTVQAALDEAKAALGEMSAHLAGTRAELDAARARLDLFEGWGPTTIGIVRRLRRIAARFPLATSLAKRAIHMRRRLLAGTTSPLRLRGPHVDDARLTRAAGVPPADGTK
jgi:FkbM family methyltransferase